ncbi:MAG: flagellin [Rhodobacteraceae bacterium]|nr:flagellin [Paracoccaceae bacterium]
MAVSVSGADITITNNTGAGLTSAVATNTGGTAGGGLNLLSQVDVTTEDGAAAALGAIEGLIQNSIDSAAAFGSSQNRIEIQSNFVGKLMDSMESGIGSLVDADMEETSARLQALQVQQQLGIQALSIANQQPQSILSLFR